MALPETDVPSPAARVRPRGAVTRLLRAQGGGSRPEVTEPAVTLQPPHTGGAPGAGGTQPSGHHAAHGVFGIRDRAASVRRRKGSVTGFHRVLKRRMPPS